MATQALMDAPPLLVLRPEYDEYRLLKEHPDLYDVVLIKDSYLAEYHSKHHLHGQDSRKLVHAVPESREVWRDPETAGLVSKTIQKFEAHKRLLGIPLAQELDLPIDVASLASDSALRDLAVDVTLENQAGSSTRTPPYFDIDRLDGFSLQVNLQMVRRTATSVSVEVPTAIVQVTRRRLLDGLLSDVAVGYARAGAQRVLLRVRGFEAEKADEDELVAFFEAVEAFQQHGVEAIPDCVGILGPVLVADGARGFSTGTRFFRKVPDALISLGGGGGGSAIQVQDLRTWQERPRDPGIDAFTARIDNLHSLRAAALLAANDPDALIRQLASGGGYPALWARALSERRRRAA